MANRRALFIDISRLIDRARSGLLPTGVDRVMLAHVSHCRGHAAAIVRRGSWRRLLGAAASCELFDLLLNPGPRSKRDLDVALIKACVPPWPSQDAEHAPALYLSHTGLDDPGWGAWVQRSRQRAVVFLHDLIPLTHPEYARPGEAELHLCRVRAMATHASAVIVNSHATHDALERLACNEGWCLPPVVVAHLGSTAFSSRSSAEHSPPLPFHYFVILGTIEPRKNHLMLLNVWRELVSRLGHDSPHLVVIGRRGWECENVVDMLERCDALKGFVHELSHCSDDLLGRYLRHARALLFPSFTEGYGMPVVEALACGTPVICGDLPVYQEVASGVPEVIEAIDGAGWLRAIHDYSDLGHPRRLAQLQRMSQWTAPTWAQHVDAVESLLGRLT